MEEVLKRNKNDLQIQKMKVENRMLHGTGGGSQWVVVVFCPPVFESSVDGFFSSCAFLSPNICVRGFFSSNYVIFVTINTYEAKSFCTF